MTMPRCSKCGGIAHIRIPRGAVVFKGKAKEQARRQDYLCLDCFEHTPEEPVVSSNAGPPV
jgi:hypothetical protein